MANNNQINRTDKVNGLKAKVSVSGNKRKISFTFQSKHCQGYDGCGTHTHGFNKPETK